MYLNWTHIAPFVHDRYLAERLAHAEHARMRSEARLARERVAHQPAFRVARDFHHEPVVHVLKTGMSHRHGGMAA